MCSGKNPQVEENIEITGSTTWEGTAEYPKWSFSDSLECEHCEDRDLGKGDPRNRYNSNNVKQDGHCVLGLKYNIF